MKLNTNITIFIGFIFLLFFKLSSFAQIPQQEHLERNIKIIYPGQTYVSKDEFLCGKTAIVITSTCISYDVENSDPYCFSQVASFVNVEKRQTKSFFYNYEQDKQVFIYGAACLNDKNKQFVELNSSNLSNCKNCEWSDYFSSDGIYIGSSDSPRTKTSFNKMKIENHLYDIFLQANRLEEITLSTVAH